MIEFKQKYELLKSKLQNLKGPTLIIIHYDLDGLTSAIIFCKILEKQGLVYNKDFFVTIAKDSYRSEFDRKEETRKFVNSYDNIFLLDYCLNSYDYIKDKNIFVFDHHKSGPNNMEWCVNPAHFAPPAELPANSALVYDFYYYLYGHNADLKKIAFIGAVSDLMVYSSLPYLHTNEKDIDLFMSNSILVKPTYTYATIMLSKIYETKGEELVLFEHLYKHSDNLRGFLAYSKEHQKIIIKGTKEELSYTEQILNELEINNDKKFVYVNIDTKHKIVKKYFLSILDTMYPAFTKLISIKHTTNCSCSIRSPTADLIAIIDKLQKEIRGCNGGGHSFAAGFVTPIESLEKVKLIILESI